MTARAADPYRELAVIDARAPRTNQTVFGVLAIVAIATGWWWLLAVLALQLAVGLTLGRRYCLPCLLYFGLIVLVAASLAYAVGFGTLGLVLGALVAALALVAAVTGFCTGCEAYKLGCRLTGRPFTSCPLPPRLA